MAVPAPPWPEPPPAIAGGALPAGLAAYRAPAVRHGYVPLSPPDFNAGAALGLSTPPPNVLIQGDCLEVLSFIPANSIDLIFADPPYNLQLKTPDLRRPNNTLVDGVDDQWDQFGSFEEYDRFTERWLSECRRILSPSGSMWVIGTYHNIFRVGRLLQDAGYWILNSVAWVKSNPMPHFRGVRFTNAHETLIWAKKSEGARKITFNYRALKELNGGKQMRSDWYLPICGGAERLRDAAGRKVHSTQKPEALLERVLLATSRAQDVVLDPFAGTGTTGAVAQRMGRRWIMVEREPDYCRLIEGRIARLAPP
jgi:modification methylase